MGIVTLVGVALVALAVALQVVHHVQTGGKLFFRNDPHEACVTLPDGTLECVATPPNNNEQVTPNSNQENQPEYVEEQHLNEHPNDDEEHQEQDDHASTTTTSSNKKITPSDVQDAAQTGNLELLQEYLTLHPEFIDVTDHNQWTALHMAARAGHLEIVQTLLRMGANKNLQTVTGTTPLDIAYERLGPFHEVTCWLNGQVVDGKAFTTEEFRLAAERGDVVAVQQYLSVEDPAAFVNEGDVNRWNALHLAARAGHVEIAKLLVLAGADVTLETNNLKTALMIASEKLGPSHEILSVLDTAGGADEL